MTRSSTPTDEIEILNINFDNINEIKKNFLIPNLNPEFEKNGPDIIKKQIELAERCRISSRLNTNTPEADAMLMLSINLHLYIFNDKFKIQIQSLIDTFVKKLDYLKIQAYLHLFNIIIENSFEFKNKINEIEEIKNKLFQMSYQESSFEDFCSLLSNYYQIIQKIITESNDFEFLVTLVTHKKEIKEIINSFLDQIYLEIGKYNELKIDINYNQVENIIKLLCQNNLNNEHETDGTSISNVQRELSEGCRLSCNLPTTDPSAIAFLIASIHFRSDIFNKAGIKNLKSLVTMFIKNEENNLHYKKSLIYIFLYKHLVMSPIDFQMSPKGKHNGSINKINNFKEKLLEIDFKKNLFNDLHFLLIQYSEIIENLVLSININDFDENNKQHLLYQKNMIKKIKEIIADIDMKNTAHDECISHNPYEEVNINIVLSTLRNIKKIIIGKNRDKSFSFELIDNAISAFESDNYSLFFELFHDFIAKINLVILSKDKEDNALIKSINDEINDIKKITSLQEQKKIPSLYYNEVVFFTEQEKLFSERSEKIPKNAYILYLIACKTIPFLEKKSKKDTEKLMYLISKLTNHHREVKLPKNNKTSTFLESLMTRSAFEHSDQAEDNRLRHLILLHTLLKGYTKKKKLPTTIAPINNVIIFIEKHVDKTILNQLYNEFGSELPEMLLNLKKRGKKKEDERLNSLEETLNRLIKTENSPQQSPTLSTLFRVMENNQEESTKSHIQFKKGSEITGE